MRTGGGQTADTAAEPIKGVAAFTCQTKGVWIPTRNRQSNVDQGTQDTREAGGVWAGFPGAHPCPAQRCKFVEGLSEGKMNADRIHVLRER